MSNENVALSLKQACQDFTEIISSLSDEQFLASMNDWSPRDVMAHLIGWNGLMMQSSLSILAGEAPSYYEDAPNDYSHINAGYINKFSSQSKQELLAELKSSMKTFEAFIHSLSAEELTVSHGVVHYSGSPATVTRIINSLASDYQHHTREIIEWLTNNGTWSRAK